MAVSWRAVWSPPLSHMSMFWGQACWILLRRGRCEVPLLDPGVLDPGVHTTTLTATGMDTMRLGPFLLALREGSSLIVLTRTTSPEENGRDSVSLSSRPPCLSSERTL